MYSLILSEFRSLSLIMFEFIFLWGYANDFLLQITWDSNPIWFVALLFIIPIWHSMHFYWTHRALHYKPLYDRVHSVHHRNISIGPWSGLSMHPVESFIYLTSIVLHLFIASSPFHLIFHLQFLVFNAVRAITLGTKLYRIHEYFSSN